MIDTPLPGGGGGGVGAPLIGAGASIVSSLIENRMNEKAEIRAYNRDLKMMNYQNEYNSPAEQMKRLKAAGLNPHLVYDKGSTGNMGAQTPKYQAKERQFDTGIDSQAVTNALSTHQAIKLSKAQEDKVKSETVATKVATANTAIANLQDSFNLSKNHKLEPYQLEIAKESARKSGIDADNALKLGNIREEEVKSKQQETLNKKKTRSLIAAQISLSRIDSKTKRWLLEQMKKGIWPNTAGWIKMAYVIGQALGISVEKVKATWETKGYTKGKFPEPEPENKKAGK